MDRRVTGLAAALAAVVALATPSAREPGRAGTAGPPFSTADATLVTWAEMAPLFRPPAEFQGKLGSYRSPLTFDDGSPVRTAAEWPRRRAEILAAWHRLMGAWPPLLERVPIEVIAQSHRETFTQRRVRLAVAPGQVVEGWLLVPDGAPRRAPAVLVPFYEPETSVGLGGRPLRDFARQLTRAGFVTLSIGTPAGDAWRPDRGSVTAQPLSYYAYVAANAWTALAALPYVDPARIGVVGHSYGGKWSMFAGALWDKFAAVATSDPGIVFDETRPNVNYWEPWYLGFDAAQSRRRGPPAADNPRTGPYARMIAEGRDLHELHALIAPRPFFVSGGAEDPPERWVALNHAVAVNALLGATERVGMSNRATHDPTALSNAQLVAFFEHALGQTPAGQAATGDPAAAAAPPGELPEAVREPIGLLTKALGPFSHPISSRQPGAQQFFDQGYQMMFAFARTDAIRSFREAWKRDPDCAICHWGEAWAWGSYLNEKMPAEDAPFAYAASRRALALRDKASERERAYIDAMAVRYVESFDAGTRRVQDEAYAESTRQLALRYPDDLDAGTLHADALFLLEPRQGRRDVEAPAIKRLHGVLEGILARNPKHPGACHLYVHATESTVRPGKAEACAEFLGASIPGASHINHMPSHTWNEVGRWGDSVRANLDAVRSDQKAEVGEGFAIYPEHNLHMLLYAASMDGQGAIATTAGRDYGKRRRGDTMYQVLTLLRFGRFDEVLAVTARPDRPVPGGLWDFAQGYAHLRTGQADMAKLYLARVRKGAEAPKAAFRDHPADRLLGLVADLLEGEILREDEQIDAAIASFERAVAKDDGLQYDEPEPLPFPARHWLGAALLEARRFADAEQVYRKDLEQHPRNGWSLLGLQQALAGLGRPDPAVDAALIQSWARSDTWVRASRF